MTGRFSLSGGLRTWVMAALIFTGCRSDPVEQTADPASVPESAAVAQPASMKPAPDVSWQTLDGQSESIQNYAGKVVILDFWATWCGPCKVAIPDLNALYAAYKEQGVVIVGITLEKLPVDSIKEFVALEKMTYPVVIGDRRVEEAYGQVMNPPQNRVTSWPTTFVIDRQGNVIKQFIGYQAEISKQELEQEIKRLL